MQVECVAVLIDLLRNPTLLVAVPFHTFADDPAVSTSSAANSVVVPCACSHGSCWRPALLHRQARLGAIERLNLDFLVDRERRRPVGRVEVKPDHIVTFSTKCLSLDPFESLHRVPLTAVLLPDPLDAGVADL